MVKHRRLIIKKKIRFDAQDIYNYIYQDSPQSAEKFSKEFENAINSIVKQPTANPPEISLPSKRNMYRFSLVLKKWKIIFKVTNKVVVLLGIIHTSQNPSQIGKLRTKNYDE